MSSPPNGRKEGEDEIQGRHLKYDAGFVTVDGKEVAIKGQFKIHFPLRKVYLKDDQVHHLTQKVGAWFRDHYKGSRIDRLNMEEQLMVGVRWSLSTAPQRWTDGGPNFEANLERLEILAKFGTVYFLLDDTMDELVGEEGYGFFCEFVGSLSFDIVMGKFRTEMDFREKWAASLGGRMWASFYPDFNLLWHFIDELLQRHPHLEQDQREFMLATPTKRFLEGAHWRDARQKQKLGPLQPSVYDFYSTDRGVIQLSSYLAAILDNVHVTRRIIQERHVRRLEHLICAAFPAINDLLGLRKDILNKNEDTKYHAYRNEGGLEFPQILRKMEKDVENRMIEIGHIYHYLAEVYDSQTELMRCVQIMVDNSGAILSYHLDNSRYRGPTYRIE